MPENTAPVALTRHDVVQSAMSARRNNRHDLADALDALAVTMRTHELRALQLAG